MHHKCVATRLPITNKEAQIQYDTRCYFFNVCSKANMSQLNLKETTTKTCKSEKLKSKNGYFQSKSLGNHVVSPEE